MWWLLLLCDLAAAHGTYSGQCDAESGVPSAMGGTLDNTGWSLSVFPSGFTLSSPVTITLKGPSGANFRGVQMYVEDPASNTLYGAWVFKTGFQASSVCNGAPALTHDSSSLKPVPVNFTWNAPTTDPGVPSLSIRMLLLWQGLDKPRIWAQLSASVANMNVVSKTPTQAPSTTAPTTVAPTMGPTCTDGLQGPEEIGVDCGGVCPACPTYVWQPQPYGQCSVPCGGGIQTRSIKCVDGVTGIEVNAANCSATHPAETVISCNPDKCPNYSWDIGGWDMCSSMCNTGIRTRSVRCLSDVGNVQVAEVWCGNVTKPLTEENCNTDPCSQARWVSLPWSPCSKSCGGGMQTRTVQCQDSDNQLTSDNECKEEPPSLQQECNNQTCEVYVWNPCPDFYPCTATCNGGTGMLGVRYKDVFCVQLSTITTVDASLCDPSTRPRTNFTSCNPQQCTGYNWMADSNWGPCEMDGGEMVRTRRFHCHSPEGGVALEIQCANVPKPVGSLPCTPNTCLKLNSMVSSAMPAGISCTLALLLAFWV